MAGVTPSTEQATKGAGRETANELIELIRKGKAVSGEDSRFSILLSGREGVGCVATERGREDRSRERRLVGRGLAGVEVYCLFCCLRRLYCPSTR